MLKGPLDPFSLVGVLCRRGNWPERELRKEGVSERFTSADGRAKMGEGKCENVWGGGEKKAKH